MNECPLTAALDCHTAISCNVLLWLLHDPNSPHNDQDVPFPVCLIGAGRGGAIVLLLIQQTRHTYGSFANDYPTMPAPTRVSEFTVIKGIFSRELLTRRHRGGFSCRSTVGEPSQWCSFYYVAGKGRRPGLESHLPVTCLHATSLCLHPVPALAGSSSWVWAWELLVGCV